MILQANKKLVNIGSNHLKVASSNLEYFVGASIQRQAYDVICDEHVMMISVTGKNEQNPEEFELSSRRQYPDAVLRQFSVNRLFYGVFLSHGLQRVQNVIKRVKCGGHNLVIVTVIDDVT